jgi:hypothetical protein
MFYESFSGLVPATSEIKQRVISARLLRMKQLQNQIGEFHHRISVSFSWKLILVLVKLS